MRPVRLALLGCGVLLAGAGLAHAGMPSMTINDVVEAATSGLRAQPARRIQNISFFLLVFFLSAWLVRGLWNLLARDFTSLPRLSYGKALGLLCLWGLLFALVLTMISGARELLTPGAWEKQGATYRLADPPDPPAGPSEEERERQLVRLREELWKYAAAHDSAFPPDRSASEIPAERWQVPGPSGMQYVYLGGTKGGARPLAYEPDIHEGRRFVLLTSGEVQFLTSERLRELLRRGEGR